MRRSRSTARSSASPLPGPAMSARRRRAGALLSPPQPAVGGRGADDGVVVAPRFHCCGLSVHQALVFITLYAAYAACYVSKRSAGYWGADAPALRGGGAGGAAGAGVGLLASSFEAAGGVAKLTGGLLVDRLPGGPALAAALAGAAAAHGALAAVGASGAGGARALAAGWAANGAFQAFAWPALAKAFLAAFPRPEQRGAWYALLATCQNAGAAAAPMLFAALAAATAGAPADARWRAALLVPGALLLAAAAAVLALGAAAPAQPPPPALGGGRRERNAPPPATAAAPPPSLLQTGALVLGSRATWLLGASYFFNTALRNGLTEVPAWLLGAAGLRLAPHAMALAVGAYELGAAGGGLAAGWLSDRVFAGRRGPPIALLSLAAAPLPLLLLLLAGSDERDGGGMRAAAIAATFGALGFCAFGPHVLNGLAAREYAPASVQASAGGFSKALGQLGGTAAGYPLGLLFERLGWRVAVVVLATAGLASGLCALPLWNTASEPSPPPPHAVTAAAAGGLAAREKAS